MYKLSIILGVLLVSGCSGLLEKQQSVCEGVALISGNETTVKIYDVRQQANQTQYKAGYPFNWQWVSKNNFTRTTCDK
ncbi:phage exclusion lipoprotein Cor [Erwinia aphidicola]|uniref:phage exclusion lipoprotein Cor n=1 Tax=Erwinia aphidicola TaxID=68334 RepID=UPI00301AA654